MHQHTGQGLDFMTNGIGRFRSLKWEGERDVDVMAGYLVPTEFFFTLCPVKETSF